MSVSSFFCSRGQVADPGVVILWLEIRPAPTSSGLNEAGYNLKTGTLISNPFQQVFRRSLSDEALKNSQSAERPAQRGWGAASTSSGGFKIQRLGKRHLDRHSPETGFRDDR